MNAEISRRKLLSGITAGAGVAVLGWSPSAQAWATDLANSDVQQVPPLDGTLELPPDPTPFTQDFGRLVQRQPLAVLTPGSVNDIVAIVKYARQNRLEVAVNGQSGAVGESRESHSHNGQALVEGGIAIDPKPLATIHRIGAGIAEVDAGATWSAVATAALETGQVQAVANDFAHLSVGGTLSVGGLGGTTQKYGTQCDNVEWLQVVTGCGELVKCSRSRNRELFDAVLAGGGQYAVIVRAGLKLVPAHTMVRSIDVVYDDRDTFLRDSLAVMKAGVVHDQNGYAAAKEGGGWGFRMALATYFTPPTVPDDNAVLGLLSPGAVPAGTAEMPYRDWLFRFDPAWAQLKAAGFWDGQKPWVSVILAAEHTSKFVASVLSELKVTDLGAGTFRISPMNANVVKRPSFMLPRRRTSDIFEMTLVRFPAPNHPDIPSLVAQNRRLYDQAVAVGGKRYLIGAIPDMTAADWQRHYGSRWSTLTGLKRRFDPDNVLTPGQGIFA